MIDLNYIDNLILNAVRNTGSLNDTELSQKLHCPRTLLLTHLKQLIDEGFVCLESNQYRLTDSGMDKMVPLVFSQVSQSTDLLERESFDWDFLYIPTLGWDK